MSDPVAFAIDPVAELAREVRRLRQLIAKLACDRHAPADERMTVDRERGEP